MSKIVTVWELFNKLSGQYDSEIAFPDEHLPNGLNISQVKGNLCPCKQDLIYLGYNMHYGHMDAEDTLIGYADIQLVQESDIKCAFTHEVAFSADVDFKDYNDTPITWSLTQTYSQAYPGAANYSPSVTVENKAETNKWLTREDCSSYISLFNIIGGSNTSFSYVELTVNTDGTNSLNYQGDNVELIDKDTSEVLWSIKAWEINSSAGSVQNYDAATCKKICSANNLLLHKQNISYTSKTFIVKNTSPQGNATVKYYDSTGTQQSIAVSYGNSRNITAYSAGDVTISMGTKHYFSGAGFNGSNTYAVSSEVDLITDNGTVLVSEAHSVTFVLSSLLVATIKVTYYKEDGTSTFETLSVRDGIDKSYNVTAFSTGSIKWEDDNDDIHLWAAVGVGTTDADVSSVSGSTIQYDVFRKLTSITLAKSSDTTSSVNIVNNTSFLILACSYNDFMNGISGTYDGLTLESSKSKTVRIKGGDKLYLDEYGQGMGKILRVEGNFNGSPETGASIYIESTNLVGGGTITVTEIEDDTPILSLNILFNGRTGNETLHLVNTNGNTEDVYSGNVAGMLNMLEPDGAINAEYTDNDDTGSWEILFYSDGGNISMDHASIYKSGLLPLGITYDSVLSYMNNNDLNPTETAVDIVIQPA